MTVIEDRSAAGNCSHEALPFVEAAAKSKLTGSIATQPSVYLASLSAFCVAGVPIMAARDEDVCRQRVVLGFIAASSVSTSRYRCGQPVQCVLKARNTHCVQSNIIAGRQT